MSRIGFSKNLNRVIRDRNLTLAKIKEATGIPMSTLSEWTAGRVPKVSDSLLILSQYLGLTLDELIKAEKGKSAPCTNDFVIDLEGIKFRVRFEKI